MNTNSNELRKQQEIAKQLLHWRWSIMDKHRTVGARLLADTDCKLRALTLASSPFTINKRGTHRPFEVLFV